LRAVVIGCVLSAAIHFPSLSQADGLNPASPGLPTVSNVYGPGSIPNNNASAMCVACHTSVPVVGGSSHFVRNASRTTTPANIPLKERKVAWNTMGGLSKYGNFGTSPPTSVTGNTGELICESCHTMNASVPGGNNLLENSRRYDARPAQPNQLDSASTTLCEGCHVSATLPGHHPMTGDLTSNGSVLSTSATAFTRAFVDNTNTLPYGAGTPVLNSGVVYPAADRLVCISCHANGHNGYTKTGATILQRGWAGAASVSPVAPGGGVIGEDLTGLDRQIDKSPARLISNWQPLCDSCHTVDD
jgi:hypothetical protein